ncbi:MAG: hypothetical protein JWM20_501 [Patescibacteria group bacterium]|nr:hypothetical protein [Patescibacteria group bacterium]
MKGFFFTLLTLVVIAALGAGGYFAYMSMTEPASYMPAKPEKIGDLHSVVTNPDTGTKGTSQAAAGSTSTASTSGASAAAATPTPTTSSVSATLSTNLTAMATNKVTLKSGNKNENVGYVQQFMNLYFKKTGAIDNTYGATLKTNVTTFQKQNKITQTGTVGPSTLQMMIMWLKNHPS